MFKDRLAISVREAAEATSYSCEAILKAIRKKKLKAVRPGGDGDYRILVEDFQDWLRGTHQVQVDRPAPHRTARSPRGADV
jgi:excisionase family DNA binding protein